MSSKIGLILSLCVCMVPVSIMFFLQGFNVIPTQGPWMMGSIVAGSFVSALLIARKTGNL